ncbi:SIR2 family protein [Lysinibacillus sp. LZ02]|uniref:SIR2 family protein n=1 Tax=Lysinibacillus sp. LZ02 TaxID=3420668 RepID=UPI003D35C5EE
MNETIDIPFPETLIEEIAYNRCIIFIGAGVSATSKNKNNESMMDWSTFMSEAQKLIESCEEDVKEYVQQCIDKRNYLHALQTIKDKSNGNGNYIALLKRAYSGNGYSHSRAHEILHSLNIKIVVSTNFDKIYETYCIANGSKYSSGHVVINYKNTDDLIHNIKSYDNVIIKAHGSIDSPDGLIFTEDNYYKSIRENHLFYKIFESLFLTHTVLFIGYSLNDPDINLLFNTAANTASEMTPHYVLTTSGTNPQLIKHHKQNFNIEPIIYGDKHEQLIPALEDLYVKVTSLREDRGLNHLIID